MSEGFYYPVKRGDSLSKIAKRYGVKDWKTIYNHTKNETFRDSHPNPNLIYPGDHVWVPDAKPNRVAISKDKKNRIIKISKPIIKKIKLGEDDSDKCTIDKPEKMVGAIYIPTKMGGDLTLIYPMGEGERINNIYYKDGNFPSESDIVPLIKEFRTGKHGILYYIEFPTFGMKCFEIKPNKKGWYFFIVDGTDAIPVKNEFSQEHSLSTEPWNSWWWPQDDGQDPNLFDETVEYDPSIGVEPGPLKKYDKYAGTEAESTSSWKWEWDNKRLPAGCGSTAGKCDATSWAGFETNKPSGDRQLNNTDGTPVVFREQDRLGLCAERYWVSTNSEVDVDEPGTTFHLFRKQGSHLKANWFHKKIKERIGEDKGGIIVYVPNWNAGIYKYKAEFKAYGTSDTDIKKVTIRNEMTHKSWDKWEGTDVNFSTKYDLEYADDGSIMRVLDWDSNGKPTKVYYKKPSAGIIHPKLNKQKLENIFK